jgi:hypothetical protein
MAKRVQHSENWERLFDGASKAVLKFFENPTPEDLPKVKVATSVLSSFTRHEQTDSAREQTAVIIARQLADNKEEFANYLKISMPKLQLLDKFPKS